MNLDRKMKQQLQDELARSLDGEKEIKKIVIFGSFLRDAAPNDLDVAVFQDSDADYLSLALKYRKKTRELARKIPVDIIPVKGARCESPFFAEIADGVTIYEA